MSDETFMFSSRESEQIARSICEVRGLNFDRMPGFIFQQLQAEADAILASEWLADRDREVAATERQRIAQLVERQRPEMGMHINVSEYRRGKDDALVIALVAIREGRS